jgi:hypothetical protein
VRVRGSLHASVSAASVGIAIKAGDRQTFETTTNSRGSSFEKPHVIGISVFAEIIAAHARSKLHSSISFDSCELRFSPTYSVTLKVTVDGCINGRKKEPLAKLVKKFESLKLIFDGIFQFGKAQFDSSHV